MGKTRIPGFGLLRGLFDWHTRARRLRSSRHRHDAAHAHPGFHTLASWQARGLLARAMVWGRVKHPDLRAPRSL